MRIPVVLVVTFIGLSGLLQATAGPLQDAAKSGDSEKVDALITGGADIDASDATGTALHWAVMLGQTGVVRVLLERGADAKASGAMGTPLHVNAIKGDPQITELLLQHGADPNSVRSTGYTPLHDAAGNGHLEMARVLIDNGADINALGSNNVPPIHLAKYRNHDDVVNLLINSGWVPPTVSPVVEWLKSASMERGEAKAKGASCSFCHALRPDQTPASRGIIGPVLWNIVNRPKATVNGYGYSSALAQAQGTWTYEDLNAFLAHPAVTLPGTAMEIPGLSEPQDRADVILFLRSLSDDPAPLP
jgi:cytochrome c